MNYNDPLEVRQTLERLAFIVELLHEGVAVTNLSGTICFANPAMARMHGYDSCQELISKSITHLYSVDLVQTDLKSMIDTVKDRGHTQKPITHTRRDGSTFPAQTKMVLLNDEQDRVTGLIVLVTDLSSQTQQASSSQHIEQLERANQRLEQQIHELNQTLKYDPDVPVSFDPDESFGSPLSIRRNLAAARRHPCQKQEPEKSAVSEVLELTDSHLSAFSEIAELLKK